MGENKQIEQKRVDEVVEFIGVEMNKLEQETASRKDEVVQIRKSFWDEVKINTDTFDDYLETIIGLRQEAQALSVSQSSHLQASKRLETLRRMKDAPYFGRIDFKEDGESDEEQVYIGVSTLADQSGENFLVNDWRAPISSVYYDHQPGTASYETPGGTVNGILEKKMQFLIEEGKLQSMFDTSLTIGDEILQQVLGKGSDKQMQSIVATIQQEQNQIIRHQGGRLLIVHGAAGSGKTSAALQRIAYLLYRNRNHLNADQIILFSPNQMFNSYVANVLPELGEENMQQVTFQEYLNKRLSHLFEVEDPYEQLESILTSAKTPAHEVRIAGIQWKASTAFFEAMNRYCNSLEFEGMVFKNIRFRGEIVITAEQISEWFYSVDSSLSIQNRLEKVKEWLLKQVSRLRKAEETKDWVLDEIEFLSKDDYQKALRFLANKRGLKREEVQTYEMEPDALARLLVQRKLKPLRKQIRAYHFVHMKGIYKQFFEKRTQLNVWNEADLPIAWEEIGEATKQMIDENRLSQEDATPYLYIQELIQGFQINRSIKQIVVDEAQDYSPFQFEYLKRLFPATKMTVLGDFNQAIFSHAQEMVDFQPLTNLYGTEKTTIIPITRSYRSTKPIIEVTRRLVPNGDQIIPFERDGEKPKLTQVSTKDALHEQIVSQVKALQEKNYQSIAVICQSTEESKQAFARFGKSINAKLLISSSVEYEQGIVIIPSYLAKGIEFDAVIIYDASVYNDESVRRLFYTACTRAMHELHLYSVGEASAFLDQVVKDGFLDVESELDGLQRQ